MRKLRATLRIICLTGAALTTLIWVASTFVYCGYRLDDSAGYARFLVCVHRGRVWVTINSQTAYWIQSEPGATLTTECAEFLHDPVFPAVFPGWGFDVDPVEQFGPDLRMSLWLPAGVLLALGLLCGWHKQSRLNPSCPQCGYCLRGNTTGLCPECGAAVSVRLADPTAHQGNE